MRESVIDFSVAVRRRGRAQRAVISHLKEEEEKNKIKKKVRNKMEAERERLHDDRPSDGQVPG